MSAVEKSRYLIPMLERALISMELLAHAPNGLSLAELSQQLDAPKSSVFNILATLEYHGFIRLDETTGRYGLSTKLFRLGNAVVGRLKVKQVLYPMLLELAEETGETVNLGILEGTEAVYIQTIEGSARVRVAVTPGERLDLHSTALGKTLLAYLPPDQVESLLQGRPLLARTPFTVTDIEALKVDLAAIRERGYALDNQEDNVDIRCIGVPIRDYSGEVIAAISLTAPHHRLPDEVVVEQAALVMQYADRMSQALGYEEAILSDLMLTSV